MDGRSPSCKYDGNQDWHANQGALYTIMKCLDVPGKSTLRFSLLNISIKKLRTIICLELNLTPQAIHILVALNRVRPVTSRQLGGVV